MGKNVVECKDLCKTFTVGDSEVHAVEKVSLKISEGEFVSVVGPSGSGKTTLLNLIGTLEKPSSGTVIIDGENTKELEIKELAEIRKEKLGFIFQFFNLVEGLTTFENAELPLIFAKKEKKERKKRVEELIKEMEINHLKDKFPEELSSGERQRVAIIRALANKPKLILADEPTGNLDSNTGKVVIEILKQLNKEKKVTILMVTHDISAAKQAKRMITMKDGKVEKDEKIEE